jgi:hypothetical protein
MHLKVLGKQEQQNLKLEDGKKWQRSGQTKGIIQIIKEIKTWFFENLNKTDRT